MISLILILLAGIVKAGMDVLQFHYDSSIFKKLNPNFWDARISWRNKWKGGEKSNGDKFFLSSTAFVFLTDGWHLLQFLFLTLICLAVVLYVPMQNIVVDFLLMKIGMSLVFELFFSKVFNKG